MNTVAPTRPTSLTARVALAALLAVLTTGCGTLIELADDVGDATGLNPSESAPPGITTTSSPPAAPTTTIDPGDGGGRARVPVTEVAETAGTTGTADAESVAADSDEGPRTEVLFESAGEFAVAFDILNTGLAEDFGFARIDITQDTVTFQTPHGAFATQPHPDVVVGGWTEVDDTVSRATVVSTAGTEESFSALVTLLSITTDDTNDANSEAINRALAALGEDGGGVGSEYLVLDGRGVLIEVVDIEGTGYLAVAVGPDLGADDAIRQAATIRAGVLDLLAT